MRAANQNSQIPARRATRMEMIVEVPIYRPEKARESSEDSLKE